MFLSYWLLEINFFDPIIFSFETDQKFDYKIIDLQINVKLKKSFTQTLLKTVGVFYRYKLCTIRCLTMAKKKDELLTIISMIILSINFWGVCSPFLVSGSIINNTMSTLSFVFYFFSLFAFLLLFGCFISITLSLWRRQWYVFRVKRS